MLSDSGEAQAQTGVRIHNISQSLKDRSSYPEAQWLKVTTANLKQLLPCVCVHRHNFTRLTNDTVHKDGRHLNLTSLHMPRCNESKMSPSAHSSLPLSHCLEHLVHVALRRHRPNMNLGDCHFYAFYQLYSLPMWLVLLGAFLNSH